MKTSDKPSGFTLNFFFFFLCSITRRKDELFRESQSLQSLLNPYVYLKGKRKFELVLNLSYLCQIKKSPSNLVLLILQIFFSLSETDRFVFRTVFPFRPYLFLSTLVSLYICMSDSGPDFHYVIPHRQETCCYLMTFCESDFRRVYN